jgi:hypothetical protein
MQKKVLNEINDMRVKMGLNILTENSILLTEGPIGSLVKTIAGKAAIKDVEKALIDKFITGSLDDAEKIAFKDFLKSMNGTKFIKEFETAIAKETDPATKLRAQAFLDNQIKSKLKSTISTTGSKSTSTVGSKSGKGSPNSHLILPNPNPTHIPSPTEISAMSATVDDIIKANRRNPEFNSYMIILENANLSPQVKDLMVASYSKVGSDAKAAIKYAEELTAMLNEKKYGWLKRQINKAMKDPSRTISVGGKTIAVGTLWYVTTLAVLALGGTAAGWITYLKTQLPKAPETSTNSNRSYSYNEAGLIEYLTDTYGNKGFGNPSKFDIVQSSDGILKVTGQQDGKTKKYKRVGNTYQEQN